MTAPGAAQPADRPTPDSAPKPAAVPADTTPLTPTTRPAGTPRPAEPQWTPRRRAAKPATIRRSAAQPRAKASSAGLIQRFGQFVRQYQKPTRTNNRSIAVTVQQSQPVVRAREIVRSIGIGRVLCWQLCLLVMIAAIGESRSVAAIAVTAAICVIIATAVRARGLWLYQWLLRAIRFLFRRHHAEMTESAESLIDAVTRDTSVETVELDDIPVAFIHHRVGVAAVLEPNTTHDFIADQLNLISPEPLLPPSDVDTPAFAAQIIMQMAQAPQIGGESRRRTWITLQAIRTADIYKDEDLTEALANAVRRLIRRLARDELPTRTLDRAEAMSLIVGLSQLGDAADGPDPVPISESWGAWQAGSTSQACFQIERWHQASESARRLILNRLQLVPSLGTTVAIAARRKDPRGQAQSNVVIRLTEANRARLDNSADLLEFAMENTGAGLRLDRLNGDHLAAVAASLPFGGQTTLR